MTGILTKRGIWIQRQTYREGDSVKTQGEDGHMTGGSHLQARQDGGLQANPGAGGGKAGAPGAFKREHGPADTLVWALPSGV